MPRTALLEYSVQFMLLRRRNCCNCETTVTFRLVPPCATQNDSAPESSALYPRSQEYQHCSSFGAPGACRLVHVMCMSYILCCQVFFAACSVASLLSTVAVVISASSSSSKGPDTKIGSQNRNPNPVVKIKTSIKTVEFTQQPAFWQVLDPSRYLSVPRQGGVGGEISLLVEAVVITHQAGCFCE